MRYRRNTEETNFWAGYADCMLALFMIALLLWILSAGVTSFTNEEKAVAGKLRDIKVSNLEKKITKLEEQLGLKDEELGGLKKRVKGLAKLVDGGKNLIDELERIKSENSELLAKNAGLTKNLADLRFANEKLQASYNELKEKRNILARDYQISIAENKRLKDEFDIANIDELLKKMALLEKEINDKPPIINLTEGVTREFSFPSGKAVVPNNFLSKLHSETFPELQTILRSYPKIDTLEIVGHTDGSPINSRGNTDLKIPELMMNRVKNETLKPGSNADLGLMRALSIRNAWYKWVKTQNISSQKRLYKIDLRCYSAAQTVPPLLPPLSKEDWLANDPAARRIEIRFTQLKLKNKKSSKEEPVLPFIPDRIEYGETNR